MVSKRRFEELLSKSIDEGLSSLGQSSRTAIYFHLEKSFHIEKQEIPRRIEPFTSAIEKIFGPGAKFLEILMMKYLHQKIGCTIRLDRFEDFTFPKYVAAAKLSFMEKAPRRKLKV